MTRRSPAQYNWARLEFDETLLTKHFQVLGSRDIRFIVVHHMTIVGSGNGSALDACYNVWQTRAASAHYGIDGNLVRQYVWDKNYAWATGSTYGNLHGLSIEHANSSAAPNWGIASDTWRTGARLAAHAHVLYRLGRPTSTGFGTGGTLRSHQSFFATACPGPTFRTIWSQYVAEVQRVYDQITGRTPMTRFSDVPASHGFYDSIDWAAKTGVTTGYGDRTFRPDRGLIRGDAAVMLWRAVGRDQLRDVPLDHPHALAIGWLQGSTLARGFGDGTFRPNAPVARGDAAVFLWRHAGEPTPEAGETFADLGALGKTHRDACAWLYQQGISIGWPSGGRAIFKPTQTITRGEWVTFLHRYLGE